MPTTLQLKILKINFSKNILATYIPKMPPTIEQAVIHDDFFITKYGTLSGV